jgi:hypothetical protein
VLDSFALPILLTLSFAVACGGRTALTSSGDEPAPTAAAASMSGPGGVDAGSCPAACTGGCANGTCVIDCTGPRQCQGLLGEPKPVPGRASEHDCAGPGSCSYADFSCEDGEPCSFECSGEDACSSAVIHCPTTGACAVDCTGLTACAGMTVICGEGPCTITCAPADTFLLRSVQGCGANCTNTCDVGP